VRTRKEVDTNGLNDIDANRGMTRLDRTRSAMRFLEFPLICTGLITCFPGCTDRGIEPPLPQSPLTLAVEDVGVTEAWLRLGLSAEATPRKVDLKYNGLVITSLTLTTSDTVIVLDSLLPNQKYHFTCFRAIDATRCDSASVWLTTMDTTSHNFTWEIDTLGQAASSVLYDVAIISDTLAYAVGEIFVRDSLGGIDPTPYSLAKWNGTGWQLMRMYYSSNGSPQVIAPIRGIAVLESQDFWFAAGSVFHWDGHSAFADLSFSRLELPEPNGTLEKIRGTSRASLCAVGNAGSIIRLAGTAWSKLESGTTLPVQDIWVGPRHANSTESICLASAFQANQGEELLLLGANSADKLPTSGLAWRLSGLWFVPDRLYIVVGDGVFVKRSIKDISTWQNLAPEVTQYYVSAVAGTGLNDVVAVGHFGEVLHFNGVSWRSLLPETAIDGAYLRVAVRQQLSMAVGFAKSNAVVLRGLHR